MITDYKSLSISKYRRKSLGIYAVQSMYPVSGGFARYSPPTDITVSLGSSVPYPIAPVCKAVTVECARTEHVNQLRTHIIER